MGIIYSVVTIRAKGAELKIIKQFYGCLKMSIEVAVVFILLHGEQRVGVVNPQGLGYLVITAIGIGTIRKRGVECLGRVKQLLFERQIVITLQRAKESKIYSEMIVEGVLGNIELGNISAVVVVADNRLVLHHTQRGAIIGLL